MSFFGLFGGHNMTDKIKDYKARGAMIIDVRTPMEYEQGHAPNSELIQMHEIAERVEEIKARNKPVILVCRTGSRAASVEAFYRRHGIDAINGGPWQAVLD